MPLSGKVATDIRLNETKTIDVAGAVAEHTVSWSWTVTNGTGANQADLIFSDTRTLAASGTENLDLAAALVPIYGGTLTLVKLKSITVSAAAGNTNNVNVTMPASGVPLFLGTNGGVAVPPGGCFSLAGPGVAGLATVVATSADLIAVTNSAAGTSVTYTVVLVGTSA